MNKILTLVGIFLIFITSVVAISEKDRILMLLGNYEEECYQYLWINTIKIRWFCNTSSRNAVWCGRNSHPSCGCPMIPTDYWVNETYTVLEKTFKCLKYHLIRKVRT